MSALLARSAAQNDNLPVAEVHRFRAVSGMCYRGLFITIKKGVLWLHLGLR
jgi:hypothetical protein